MVLHIVGTSGNGEVMTRIAVVHPGEMGSAVGNALTAIGHDVFWIPAGRGPQTRIRASNAGLQECEDVRACDVVISICPPAFAVSTALSVGPFEGIYVDANAVSPRIAEEVRGIVRGFRGEYVDAGLIGPPPTRAATTRLYLSGEQARTIAADFADSRIEAHVLDAGDFAASGLKMTYAAWTKISAALVLAARDAAAELGVAPELTAEWVRSQPGLSDRYKAALADAAAKGWRWKDEMQQISRTFVDAGQPGEFGTAAAQIFGRWPRP
jgi:3-hydroxyisobutyrate dehydrogenase-like beta-hydroxyacid dehydrogenase